MSASPAIRTVAAGTIDRAELARIAEAPIIRMIRFHVAPASGLAIGGCRSSLSALGGQPLFNEDDTVRVTLKASSISLFPSLAATSRWLNRRFRTR